MKSKSSDNPYVPPKSSEGLVEPAATSAPWPGSHQMPQWTVNDLPEAPVFSWRNILGMIGPGLVMGAAAIGGGEWTLGPKVTAQYGGSILWLATLSILFQVIYNIEICRYTLYSGEPIFTGKFRLHPGPIFWVCLYVLVDWGSFFPYLLSNAAVPLYALLRGELPPDNINEVPEAWWFHKILTLTLFVLMLIPLIFGGKVYNSLKAVMSFKLVYVLGLLLFLGIFYSHASSWGKIFSGFVQFGNVPVVVDAEPPAASAAAENTDAPQKQTVVANAFVYRAEHGSWPTLDLSLAAYLCALAAIAGNGGLTNAPISNFVRDQGWGMGKHVGAIPSVIGGQGIELSHEGSVFLINPTSLERWRKWVWHVMREQIFVWLPACIVGVALPSILSIEFLAPGTNAGDWNLAAMTAEGVQKSIESPPSDVLAAQLGFAKTLATPQIGKLFFQLILFCGFLVLITSGISTADGFCRRWVDLIWVGIPRLRKLPTNYIKYVYFSVLMFYAVVGFTMLILPQAPGFVTKLATTGYNFALAFSSLHTLAVNLTLLPKQLRPNWFFRILLVCGFLFFGFLGVMGALSMAGVV
jgi:hypothetical protein